LQRSPSSLAGFKGTFFYGQGKKRERKGGQGGGGRGRNGGGEEKERGWRKRKAPNNF